MYNIGRLLYKTMDQYGRQLLHIVEVPRNTTINTTSGRLTTTIDNITYKQTKNIVKEINKSDGEEAL